MNSDQMMIKRQAEIISDLNRKIKHYGARIDALYAELNNYKAAGTHYMNLQKAIIANPILQSEWDRFLSFVKMADLTDVVEGVKSLEDQ